MSDNTKRITARFQAQAWLNDYAIDVDPEGPTTWDVTEEIVAMGRDKALALKDNQYETDDLRFSRNAPEWVREWTGPFYICVEESIAMYFAS